MTATIIDGKAIAAETRTKVAVEVARLAQQHAVVPGLAVVLVGNNPASEVYVGSKKKMTVESGMKSFDHHLPESVSKAELLQLIARLNADGNALLKSPEIVDVLAKQGLTPTGGSSADLATLTATDLARWGRVIREAHITAE